MTKERFKSIVAVYMILERDGQIFLMRRANTGYMDGMYGLPAGHHDGGQTLREAVAREAHEELGITIKPEDAEFVFTLHRPFATDGDRVDAYFRIKAWEGEPKNIEPEKCDDLGWFGYDALPDNLISKLKIVFEGMKNGEHYAEVDDRVEG
ncbi:MAG: NUDIX domain-containing protein [Patescibacteria group bacterium]|jgi:mutator protein MutT